jgi:hypothetical protein
MRREKKKDNFKFVWEEINMINQTLFSLFPTFPREVGIPHRKIVKSLKDFENFIDSNNGINNCFVSCFANDYTIDKVFFDLDYGNSFIIAKNLYKIWTEAGYNVIPVASGKKGYHLYVKFRPVRVLDVIQDNDVDFAIFQLKELLLKAAFGLITMAYQKLPKEVDTHVLGDVRRIARIPGTKRPPRNEKYCTFLPPYFPELTEKEVRKLIRKENNFSYSGKNGLGNFFDFQEINIDGSVMMMINEAKELSKGIESFDEGDIIASKNMIEYLKPIMRPCILGHIIRTNPCHMARVAAGLELLQIFTVEQITNIFGKIGWYDFNKRITKYHLGKLEGQHPMGPTKLTIYQLHTKSCVCYSY